METINEIMNKHRNNRILPKEFNGDSSDQGSTPELFV
jgi:hypothetical protein